MTARLGVVVIHPVVSGTFYIDTFCDIIIEKLAYLYATIIHHKRYIE